MSAPETETEDRPRAEGSGPIADGPVIDMAPVERFVASRRGGLSLAFLLGALVALGQAPVSWPWAAMLALALAFGLFTLPLGWRLVAWRGWAFGTGYFAAALFWIVEPFFVDPVRHGWMAPFALIFLSGGLALFWAAAFGVSALAGGPSHSARTLALVLALTLAEVVRSVVLTGFPWALIGHVWIGWPQMQLAAFGGADTLTFLTLSAAALPALFGARRLMLGAIGGAALAAAPGALAALRVPADPAGLTDPPQIVRVIQPNAPQHLKWRADMMPVFWQRSLDLTAASPGPFGPPDLIVWPETSVPALLSGAAPYFAQIAAAAEGARVVAGLQRRDSNRNWRNSLVTLGPGGAVGDLYDKHHLVPFGEYMPAAEVFARAGVFGLAANLTGGYVPGPGPRLIDMGAAGVALPLICYEAIFARDILRAEGRPDWLMHVTNDAWFGQLSGPYQHLAQSRLRAVEFGLPVIRAANTGVSAVIDPFGRVTASIDLGTSGFADAPLPAALAPTAYARYGGWPLAAALLLGAGVVAALRRRGAAPTALAHPPQSG